MNPTERHKRKIICQICFVCLMWCGVVCFVFISYENSSFSYSSPHFFYILMSIVDHKSNDCLIYLKHRSFEVTHVASNKKHRNIFQFRFFMYPSHSLICFIALFSTHAPFGTLFFRKWFVWTVNQHASNTINQIDFCNLHRIDDQTI